MSDDAARVEAARRDFEWEVFVASDGIKSIRQSGMTHEDAFVAGAAWQAAQDQAELATWQKIANEQEDQIEAYRAETASLIQAAQPVVASAEQVERVALAIAQDHGHGRIPGPCAEQFHREARAAIAALGITVEPTRTDLCSICGEYPSHVEHRHTVEPTPHAQCTPPFHVAECDDYSEDIGYGVRTCGGCGQRVPLYVMGVMCAHYVDGKVCGWSHS